MLNVFTLLHVATIIAVAARIFSRRSPAGSAIAWLLLVITVPFVGALLYLFIGERRLGRKWMKRAKALHPQWMLWTAGLDGFGAAPAASATSGDEALARLARAATGIPAVGSNHLLLLGDSEAIMRALIADIDAARSSVRLEFYIWNAGGFVDDLVAALVRAARRGVDCCILIDALGSRPFLRTATIGRLADAGVEVIEVLPVSPLRALFVRLDLRNHRKIAVIDRRIAYTGSMNIADPRFFKQDAGVGEWVDAMARIEGPTAWVLEAVSLSITSLQTGLPFAPPAPPEQPTRGDALVQVVPSGPHATTLRIDALLLAAIYSARSEIVLTTPYFVPGEALLTALRSAALRDVRVTLIVPEKVDSRLVRYASDAYVDDLLAAGVTILRFNAGLLHTKSVVIDERVTIFGTVNLDLRSFELNFEVSMIAYDSSFSRAVRNLQRSYEARANALEPAEWRQRPRWRRYLENAAQTIGPLL